MKEATARKVKIDVKRKSPTTESKYVGSCIRPSSCPEGLRPSSVGELGEQCRSVPCNRSETQGGEGPPTNPGMSKDQDKVIEDEKGRIFTSARHRTHVTFLNHVLVKTIPDCLDYLALDDDDSSSHFSSIASGDPDVATITKAPLKGITNPFLPDPSVYKTMPKPIPQRPIHPRLVKIQCVTNAAQSSGPRMSQRTAPTTVSS
jgi:hypothetical protein